MSRKSVLYIWESFTGSNIFYSFFIITGLFSFQ
ncbi:Uncharacterized protein BM_BM18581 [Brugia malayi]|uniref:Uncharacterized protein n=1 Tax=Brugia malayi TaxID=6279 RepID=A0A4E9EUB9_BRUMA|nr:Uncharacterized protein BM_BM18581 [Brugia malayi]VIO87482.1 Uncharacterized protein BM_BM18581 [Brugia malayi]